MQRSLSSFSNKQSRPGKPGGQSMASSVSSRRGSRGGGGASPGGFSTSYLHFMNPAKAPRLPSPIPIDESEVDALSQQLFMRTATVRAYPTVENWFRTHAVQLDNEAMEKNALADIREKVEIPDAFHQIRTMREEQRQGKEKMMQQFEEVYQCAAYQESVGNAFLQSFARYGKHYLSQLEGIEQTLRQRRREAEEWTVRGERERVQEKMRRFKEKFAQLRVRMEEDASRLQRSSAIEMGRMRLAFEDCLAEIRDVVSWYVLQHSRGANPPAHQSHNMSSSNPNAPRVRKTKRAQMLAILGDDNPFYIQHNAADRAAHKRKRKLETEALQTIYTDGRGSSPSSDATGTTRGQDSSGEDRHCPHRPHGSSRTSPPLHSGKKEGVKGKGDEKHEKVDNPNAGGAGAEMSSIEQQLKRISAKAVLIEQKVLKGFTEHLNEATAVGRAWDSEVKGHGNTQKNSRDATEKNEKKRKKEGEVGNRRGHRGGHGKRTPSPALSGLRGTGGAVVRSAESVRKEDRRQGRSENEKRQVKQNDGTRANTGERSSSHLSTSARGTTPNISDSRRNSSSSSSNDEGDSSSGRRPSTSSSFIHSIEDRPLLEEESQLKRLLHRHERHRKRRAATVQQKRMQEWAALKEVLEKEKQEVRVGAQQYAMNRSGPKGDPAHSLQAGGTGEKGDGERGGGVWNANGETREKGSKVAATHRYLRHQEGLAKKEQAVSLRSWKERNETSKDSNTTSLPQEQTRRKDHNGNRAREEEKEEEEEDFWERGAPPRRQRPSSRASSAGQSPPPPSSPSPPLFRSSARESTCSRKDSMVVVLSPDAPFCFPGTAEEEGGKEGGTRRGRRRQPHSRPPPARPPPSPSPQGRVRRGSSVVSTGSTTWATTSSSFSNEEVEERQDRRTHTPCHRASTTSITAATQLPHPPIEDILAKLTATMEKHPVHLSPYESLQQRRRRRRASRRRSSWGSTFSSMSQRAESNASSLLQSTAAMDARVAAVKTQKTEGRKGSREMEERRRTPNPPAHPGDRTERGEKGGSEKRRRISHSRETNTGHGDGDSRDARDDHDDTLTTRSRSNGREKGEEGGPPRSSRRHSVSRGGGKVEGEQKAPLPAALLFLPATRSLAALEMLSLPPPAPRSIASAASPMQDAGEGSSSALPIRGRHTPDGHRSRRSVWGTVRHGASPVSERGTPAGRTSMGLQDGGKSGATSGSRPSSSFSLPPVRHEQGASQGGVGSAMTSSSATPALGMYAWPPSISLADGDASRSTRDGVHGNGPPTGEGGGLPRASLVLPPPSATSHPTLSLPRTTSASMAVLSSSTPSSALEKRKAGRGKGNAKPAMSGESGEGVVHAATSLSTFSPATSLIPSDASVHPKSPTETSTKTNEKPQEGTEEALPSSAEPHGSQSSMLLPPAPPSTSSFALVRLEPHDKEATAGQDTAHKGKGKVTPSAPNQRRSLIPSSAAMMKKEAVAGRGGSASHLPAGATPHPLAPPPPAKKIFRFRPRRPSSPVFPPTSSGSRGADSALISTEHLQQLVNSLSEEAIELKQLLTHSTERSVLLLQRLGNLQTSADKLLVSNVRIKHDKEALREEIRQKAERNRQIKATADFCQLQEHFDATLLREEQETVLEDLKEVLSMRKAELAHTKAEIEILSKKIKDQDELLLRVQHFWRQHAMVMRDACKEEMEVKKRCEEGERVEEEESEEVDKRGGELKKKKTATSHMVSGKGREGKEDGQPKRSSHRSRANSMASTLTASRSGSSGRSTRSPRIGSSYVSTRDNSFSVPLSPRSRKSLSSPDAVFQRRFTKPPIFPVPTRGQGGAEEEEETPEGLLRGMPNIPSPPAVSQTPPPPLSSVSPTVENSSRELHGEASVVARTTPYPPRAPSHTELDSLKHSSPSILSPRKGKKDTGHTTASGSSPHSPNGKEVGGDPDASRSAVGKGGILHVLGAKLQGSLSSPHTVSGSFAESLLKELKEETSNGMTPIQVLHLRHMDEIAEFIYSVFEAH